MDDGCKKLLQNNNLVDGDGKLNDHGWKLFSTILEFVGPYPDLTPGKIPSPYGIFDKFLSKIFKQDSACVPRAHSHTG